MSFSPAFIQPFFLFFTFNHMPDSCHRIMEQHAWSGKSHNLSDFLPHIRLIAMHAAIRTEGFCLHKRTLITAKPCILIELFTFPAQGLSRMMLLVTIYFNHQGDHLFFPFPFCTNILLHIALLPLPAAS